MTTTGQLDVTGALGLLTRQCCKT